MAEKLKFNRRDFLKVIGAGAGVAAAGCAKDLPEKFIPYVIQPDEVVPGVATWYAGSCNECSSGCGVLVKTREGRAIKIEGNSAHPINKGGLCAHGQAALQSLYNPDRVREPLKRDIGGNFVPVSWKDAIDLLAENLAGLSSNQAKAVLLTAPTSGSEKAIIEDFANKVPGLEHLQYELFNSDALDIATTQLFGTGLKTSYDLSKARVIVGFGADYLETWLSPVEFSRGWSEGRKGNASGKGSKVIHIEPRLSLTAGNADLWLMNKAGTESYLLAALLKLLLEKMPNSTFAPAVAHVNLSALQEQTNVSLDTLKKVADELLTAKDKGLVLAGGALLSGSQAVEAAMLSSMINYLIGSIGTTVVLNRTTSTASSSYKNLVNLVSDIANKKAKVGTLIISGTNPAYTLPKAVKFKEALSRVGFVVAVSTHLDETATLANLVLPLSHQLETWADSEPRPGVMNLNQPSMQPLYKTQSLGDTIISVVTNSKIKKPFPEEISSFYDYIRANWKQKTGAADFENRWLTYVEKGGDWSNYDKSRASASIATTASDAVKKLSLKAPVKSEEVSLLAYPSINSIDGSSANKPWMQELPNPITSAVWGSWIEINPDLAEKIGVKTGDLTQIVKGDVAIEAPAYITKRIDASLVAIPIGQGHTAYGRYAVSVGANPLMISDVENLDFQSFVTSGVKLRKSLFKDELVLLQGSDTQMKRGIARSITATEFLKKKEEHHSSEHHEGGLAHHDPLALGPREEPKMMFKQMDHVLYKWGMSIDLASCTGCSACVVACYAENNISVVGKTICNEGREMSWLRIERYFDGPEEQPVDAFLPMMCQQCGNAPCEPVCPVYATYHTDEGLNSMAYNRCVGTRYCSNNCSYKVRRFNWFKYDFPEPMNWQLNPDVSTREVGIMEKCSFCVQRIREVQNLAKDNGRPVQDGEIQPACASSCPTGAIKFGNLLDEQSLVAKDHKDPRSYKVLDVELNSQPAIAYLARVRNEI